MACVPSRSQLIDDRELLEVVGGAAVEGHDLFELGRGRRGMVVAGPDEVADLDFFDRLGGVRRAGIRRVATLASGRPLPDLQKECCTTGRRHLIEGREIVPHDQKRHPGPDRWLRIIAM